MTQPAPTVPSRLRPGPSLALRLTLPLLLFLPAAAATRGGEAFFLTGIYGLVIAVCSLRVVLVTWELKRLRWRGLSPPPRYYKGAGSFLSIAVSIASIAWFSYQLAPVRAYAHSVAGQVQEECDRIGRCPAAMNGWTPRHDMYSSMTIRGDRLKWPVLYRSDGKEFTVTIYLLMESRIDCTGGVGRTLAC